MAAYKTIVIQWVCISFALSRSRGRIRSLHPSLRWMSVSANLGTPISSGRPPQNRQRGSDPSKFEKRKAKALFVGVSQPQRRNDSRITMSATRRRRRRRRRRFHAFAATPLLLVLVLAMAAATSTNADGDYDNLGESIPDDFNW